MHQNIVALSSIGRFKSPGDSEAAQRPAATTPCRAGPRTRPEDLPQSVWAKIQDHPCYSEDAHHYFARMHIAVAPACNIQCNYCNRKYDCSNESRPGVVSEKLTPQRPSRRRSPSPPRRRNCRWSASPGRGTPWRTPSEPFRGRTGGQGAAPFEVVSVDQRPRAARPCRPDRRDGRRPRDDHHQHGRSTVGAQIYPWIFFRHRRWEGVDASRILHERQMEGLEALTAGASWSK